MARIARQSRAPYWKPPPLPLRELPELAYIGHYVARQATPMTAHWHDCLEVCYIEDGMADWWVEREPYRVRGGCVMLMRPHEAHGAIGAVHEPCSYYFAGIRLNARTLLGVSAPERRALRAGFTQLPHRCFEAPAHIGAQFAAILRALGTRSALTLTTVRAALLNILLQTLSAGAVAKPAGYSPVVRETLAQIEGNLEYPLRLDELARRLGWSASHVKTRFRREMGVSPGEYYLRRRIAQACTALRESREEIGAIAHRLGFQSSQYFATAFKRIVGTTPRGYRGR